MVQLLAASTIEDFLYYALPTHFKKLVPILERMLTSNLPEVIKVGARQACLSSLMLQEARYLGESCLAGTETHPHLSGEIFVANLKIAQCANFARQV